MYLKKILQWFSGPKTKKKFAFKLLASDLRKILKNQSKCLEMVVDTKYQVYRYNDVHEFLMKTHTDREQYVSDFWDCDDFSWALYAMARYNFPGIPFGVAYFNRPNGAHAVNFFIDENTQFWLVEPQTDAVIRVPEKWKCYFRHV